MRLGRLLTIRLTVDNLHIQQYVGRGQCAEFKHPDRPKKQQHVDMPGNNSLKADLSNFICMASDPIF